MLPDVRGLSAELFLGLLPLALALLGALNVKGGYFCATVSNQTGLQRPIFMNPMARHTKSDDMMMVESP